MITTQIQLGANGFLDLQDDIAIPLNFGINEIRDIGTKGSNFSKNIKVLGTAKNRQLFGQLFNVNIANSTFDINVKTPCTVLRNGVPIFNGYLRLDSIEKREEDESVFFNIVIIDDVGNFYTAMADFELTDITFDWTPYNHTYTLASITATSVNTAYNSVYKYHLFANGKSEYNLQDFKPSIWAKRYWDSIFVEAGYTYTWNSMTSCGFDKLIIPSNCELPKQTDAELDLTRARAGWSVPQTELNLYFGNRSRVIPNDDSTPPFLFDNDNIYNPAPFNGFITSNINGSLNVNMGFNYRVYLKNNGPYTVYLFGNFEDDGSGTNVEATAQYTVKVYDSFTNAVLTALYPTSNSEFFGYELEQDPTTISRLQVPPSGETVLFAGTSPNFNMIKNVFIGEEIANMIYATVELNGTWSFLDPFQFGAPAPLSQGNTNYPQLFIDIGINPPDYSNNYLIIDPASTIINEGNTIFLQNFIPKQIKQRDFISSIVKMFNLYLVTDPNNDKNIIVKTRDEFYDQGPILDWTNKIDISQDVKIDFLPELQNASLLYTHKDDTNDIVAKTYRQNQNEIYGQYRYVFDNEWVQSEKKIETIFSVAPLTTDYFNNVVTTGGFRDIRILYDGGQKPGIWKYRSNPYQNVAVTKDFTPYPGFTFTSYPYAGHFDNPLAPSLDFNFGLLNETAYNGWEYLTNNNLFNRFWYRTTNQISTGKLYTAKFLLTEKDILNLNLASKIWIRDCYWYINNIKDYDPNKNGLTVVELLSVEEINNFSAQRISITRPGTNYNWAYNEIARPYQNIENNSGIGVVGVINTGIGNSFNSGAKDTTILGDGNSTVGTGTLISGSGNLSTGSKNMIFGDNNVVTANNVMIFGLDNVRADQPGVNLLGSTLNYVNYIEAGRNQVINKYPSTKVINYIDAGRDTVRAIGSLSIETNIVAGRDQIV